MLTRDRNAALQFLMRGIDHGERGVLITDQKPSGSPIDVLVERGDLIILNPGPRYFHLVGGPADMLAIVEELGDYVKRIGAKRLVIDPITTLVRAPFAEWLTTTLLDALDALPLTTMIVLPLEAAETEDHAGEERGVEGAAHHQFDAVSNRKLAKRVGKRRRDHDDRNRDVRF